MRVEIRRVRVPGVVAEGPAYEVPLRLRRNGRGQKNEAYSQYQKGKSERLRMCRARLTRYAGYCIRFPRVPPSIMTLHLYLSMFDGIWPSLPPAIRDLLDSCRVQGREVENIREIWWGEACLVLLLLRSERCPVCVDVLRSVFGGLVMLPPRLLVLFARRVVWIPRGGGGGRGRRGHVLLLGPNKDQTKRCRGCDFEPASLKER